jgi:dihydrofolate synthase/folylpolyglutamate synthase
MRRWVSRLEALDRQGWRFGLDVTRALLAELGDLQKTLVFAHVAGSNGKGSTCAYLARLLERDGLKVGLYTSPHLVHIRERFRVDGHAIPERDFDRLAEAVLFAGRRVAARLDHGPTTFEALTALAVLWFWEQRVDVVVWETGLGGRLDATNAIDTPAVALIAPVGLEHQEWLGSTLWDIAGEKAGILKEGGRAASLQTHPEAARRIRRVAEEVGCELWEAGRDFRFRPTREGLRWSCLGSEGSFPLAHRPPYDVANAALALAGYHLLRLRGLASRPPSPEALSQTRWPARFELLSSRPLVLMDGAHNPEGVRRLGEGLRARYPGRRWTVLNGFLRDKQVDECLHLLAPFASSAVVTMPPTDRAEKGEVVVRAWERRGVPVRWVGDPRQALAFASRQAGEGGLLICGSLYLCGLLRGMLKGRGDLETI